MNPLNPDLYKIEDEIFRRNFVSNNFKKNIGSDALSAQNGADDLRYKRRKSNESIGRSETPDSQQYEDTYYGKDVAEIEEYTVPTFETNDQDLVPKEKEYSSDDNSIQKIGDVFSKKVIFPRKLIGLFAGRERRNVQNIEKKYGCEIKLPNKGEKKMEVEIEIKSNNTDKLKECAQHVLDNIKSLRKKAFPTHFFSIPINDAEFCKQYQTYVQAIQSSDEIPKNARINKIYVQPQKLHLTLSVLFLFTEKDINLAIECVNNVLNTKIRDIMGSDHSLRLNFPELEHFDKRKKDKIDVIYAKVSSDERLQRIADILDEELSNMGLTKDEHKAPVSLHMTVINTKYLNEPWQHFISAVEIFDKFGKLNFKPVDINEIHLCEMSSDIETKSYKKVHVTTL